MKIHPEISAALEATGLPYEVAKSGQNWKIKLNGSLVGTIALIPKRGHEWKNVVSQIKRAAIGLPSNRRQTY